jgi:hypothetical protein
MTYWPKYCVYKYKSFSSIKSEVPLTHNNYMESVNMGDSRDGTKTAAIFYALGVELNRGRRERLRLWKTINIYFQAIFSQHL